MKAIVLSHDIQIGLVELLVKSYMKLWKKNPFTFLVPRNDSRAPGFEYLEKLENVKIISSAPDIRATMNALLESIPDEQWVFWCCDDRYPIAVNPRLMEEIVTFIASPDSVHFSAIKLLKWLEPINKAKGFFTIRNQRFCHQNPVTTRGFWHHQFVRGKVLKYMFLSRQLPETYSHHQMNHFYNDAAYLPFLEQTILPCDENIIHLGEPLFRGRLTQNGMAALQSHNCPLPPYKSCGLTIHFSDLEKQQQQNPQHPKIDKSLKQNILRQQIKVAICSFGGVGSKCLVKGILADSNKERIRNAHFHFRNPPPNDFSKGRKIIYLFGNPMNAVISFFNRREVKSDLHGFGPNVRQPDVYWVQKHCRNLGIEDEPIRPDWTLKEYLKNGQDLFGLEDHFDNWVNTRVDYPILYVRYETMWLHLTEIFNYLDLDLENIGKFPPQRQRNSSWEHESSEIKTGLQAIYGNLYEKIEKFPDIEYRGQTMDG